MKIKFVATLFLTAFVTACGVLVWQTGIFTSCHRSGCKAIIPLAAEVNTPAAALPIESAQKSESAALPQMTATVSPLKIAAISSKEQKVTLGQVYEEMERTDDPNKYKFQVELTSLGAAIATAELSEFSDLNPKEPKPLRMVSPILNGRPVYSMACESLYVIRQGQEFTGIGLAFPLDKLNWQLVQQDKNQAVFVAELGDVETIDGSQKMTKPLLRITRTYSIQPGSYELVSDIRLENLSTEAIRVQMNLSGPTGISHEGLQRDTLKVFAAFQTADGKIESRFVDTPKMKKSIEKGKYDDLKFLSPEETSTLQWAALTNKYFTAIAYPSTETSKGLVRFETARYYPDRPGVRHSENGSFVLKTGTFELGAAGSQTASTNLAMNLYLGPKDKKLFEQNPVYSKLAFFQTLDFSSCCCPKSIIAPLAFGIVWLMNSLYQLMGPLGNYGIVIMFFVFLIRLLLHPITKSGQVQMMKMQKMQPKIQEIQRKYADNKAEMQKQMMLVYREGGVSQAMFMVPMFLQMPIWIALWTAVSISIDLRGQGFLPFWITDLSAPDAIFRFTPIVIPFIGAEVSSFNLLPLLMGGVMYLQQKMTPQAQTATTSPEMAQQQKIMSVMMVGMFPVMLYNGASGVNLYIMSSIAAGVVEQYVIRKHLKEKQEQAEENLVPTTAKIGKVKKKKVKPMFRFDK
jgi:YidC/Oxa1 family membrane protein insertase